ncbi:MAG: superoxide dismutase family protein [Acidobacteria bacterium]|nr:superoxide dismutase family protein [Acidobacteriota bacterium]
MLLAVFLSGCGPRQEQPAPPDAAAAGQDASAQDEATGVAGSRSASAELQPLGASGVGGRVTFEPAAGGDGVTMRAEVTGLTPGKHGIHVHEWGDCSAPDGTSAGSHFNPTNAPHGAPGPSAHVGDFGNLEAGQDGRATIELMLHGATLDQGDTGILGRAVIVHEKEDDLVTQPTGNSGARIACGVITTEGGNTQPVTAPPANP